MTKNEQAREALQAEHDALGKQIKDLSERRAEIFKAIPQLEADVKATEDAIVEAVKRGTKPPSRAIPANKLADAHADVMTLDRALAELKEEQGVVAKKLALVKQAEHDASFGALLAAYMEEERKLVEKFYRPMITCWLEDSRRLPNFSIPSYDPAAMEHRRAQADAFLTPAKPAPLPKTHVLMRFKKSWNGSTSLSTWGFTTAYPEGAVAAFPLKVADQLERAGAACYVQK
jgi:hypothetical protein